MQNMSYEDVLVTTETTATEATTITTAQTTEDKFGVIFYIIVMKCCLSVVIFLVNGVPLYILKRYIKHINAVHLTIAYLASADIFLGLDPWLRLVLIFMKNLNWQKTFCVFALRSNAFSQHWKIQAIMLIAAERYLLVARSNFHHKHVTPAKFKYVFVAGVTFTLVAMIISSFTQNTTPKPGECFGTVPGKKIRLFFSSIYWIYTLIIIFSYVKIIILIWKKRKAQTDRFKVQHTKKEKKTTILTMIVISLFLVTTAPRIMYVMSLPENPTKGQYQFGKLLSLLWFCNSIVNPLIYTCKVPAFKEAYAKIFGRFFQNTSRNRVGEQINVQEFRSNMNVHVEPRRDVDLVHHV